MKKLNNIISNDMEFGHYFLFQKYNHVFNKERNKYDYIVSKPIMCMFIQWWPCDQTVDVEYLVWEKYGIHRNKQIPAKIQWFAEWMNYGDILGKWTHKPTWKEILVAYRKMNNKELMQSEEINWNYE